jgi:DNA-binding transcriptional regulator YiaG
MPRNQKSKTLRFKEADHLKRLRSSLGMTQRDLAKEFKVSPGTIALWELGNRTLPGPVLKLIEIYELKIQKGK